jgi:5-methylcytosine-specific restriction protein A
MALRPKTICNWAGCGKAIDNARYCERHEALHQAQENKRKSIRNEDYSRMYTWNWRKYSSTFLKAHPLCLKCLEDGKIIPATEVDHIVPHKGDKDLFWQEDNHAIFLDRNQIEIVQITSEHLLVLAALPQHHSDPFDRLIVSQAISENLTLYSRDKGLKKYALQQEWG